MLEACKRDATAAAVGVSLVAKVDESLAALGGGADEPRGAARAFSSTPPRKVKSADNLAALAAHGEEPPPRRAGLEGLFEAARQQAPPKERDPPGLHRDFLSLSVHGMPPQRVDAETKAAPPGPAPPIAMTPGPATAPLKSPPLTAPPRLHSVWPSDPASGPRGGGELKGKPVEIQIELETAV